MQLLIAPGKANAVIKRLAYDAVQVASLHHNDWVCVCQGLQHDLSSDETLEVQIRVLELITMLPELHVELLLSNTDLEQKLLEYVRVVLSFPSSCAPHTTTTAEHLFHYIAMWRAHWCVPWAAHGQAVPCHNGALMA